MDIDKYKESLINYVNYYCRNFSNFIQPIQQIIDTSYMPLSQNISATSAQIIDSSQLQDTRMLIDEEQSRKRALQQRGGKNTRKNNKKTYKNKQKKNGGSQKKRQNKTKKRCCI